MKYLMITNWDGHWDSLKNNITQYNLKMLRPGIDISMLPSNAETIFIKREKNKKSVEKAWVGKTSNFQKYNKVIKFQVTLENEIDCPPEYINLPEGWYPIDTDLSPVTDTAILPNFMNKLLKTKDWIEFENNVYMLLKSIGINDIYKFEQYNQKGKADGYFSFGNLSVLYDCTLNPNFEKEKDIQISNFCDQLRKDKIEVKNKKITIGHKKAIWIITQSKSSRLMDQVDEIKVKEIAVNDLIKLYTKRIASDLDSEGLEESLKNIN